MPAILEKYVKGLTKKGYSKSKSFAIATALLQKKGILRKGTQKLNRRGRR
jgi:hypothetical protein